MLSKTRFLSGSCEKDRKMTDFSLEYKTYLLFRVKEIKQSSERSVHSKTRFSLTILKH